MNDRPRLIDTIRYFVNSTLSLDVVKVSGQHTLRTHLMRIIRDYQIDAVIDVGANEGGFAKALRSIGFHGLIYSFEPVNEAFAKLAAAASSDPQWSAFNMALGCPNGKGVINVSQFTQYSSMLDANEYGASWENMAVSRTQEVEVRTLDDCFESGLMTLDKRYLLKMDTQGFDTKVFEGASNSLEHIWCMLSELSLIPIYNHMPHYLESLAIYERSGFLVSGMFPITRKANLALNEVDCLMINSQKS